MKARLKFNKPAEGTTIRLYLPRSKTSANNTEEQQVNIDLPRGKESMLIVDDEVDLLVLTEKFLQNGVIRPR